MMSHNKNKKIFVTYGTKNYNLQKKQLIYLVDKSKIFDEVIGYSPENLDLQFKNKFSDILSINKGGGYWIWKYKIILQKLLKMNKNDILVYFDSGGSFNPGGKQKLLTYINLIQESKHFLLQFQMKNLIEEKYTTTEIFNYFGVENNKKITKTGQYMGGLLFFKKNEESLEYLNNYEKLLYKDKFLITDKYNKNQKSYFIANRHDQSIFSVMSKIYGSEVIDHDPTYFKDNPMEQFSYPFLAVRRRKLGFFSKLNQNILYYFGLTKTSYWRYEYSYFERVIYKIKNFFK